jgi:hypothetical protein
MAAREVNLTDIVAIHEGGSKWLAKFVKSEGVEYELDVCINGLVRTRAFN